MKAIVHDRYGTPDVLELRDLPEPEAHDDEVLVQVHAASVNAFDWHTLTGLPYLSRLQMGLRTPKFPILGGDLAGTVEAVGKGVTRFRPGDEVFGEFTEGTCAEYVAVPEQALAPKPANLTFEEAAAVPIAGNTALQALRDKGLIRAGQKVLINGASGGVGSFAVQIAKSFDAEVTAVCSTRNVDMVQSIGADHVIDYTQDDFTLGGSRYDLILDNVGNHSLRECRRVLEPRGIYVASFGRPHKKLVGPMPYLLAMLVVSPFVSQKLVVWVANQDQENLLTLKALIEEGMITPIVDRTYLLSETREAMEYMDEGHARAKVVITMMTD